MGACASEGEEEQPTEAKKPDADGDGIPDWADKDEEGAEPVDDDDPRYADDENLPKNKKKNK